MHRMLFLAIFAAIITKTVLGAVCEGLAEQNEQKLVIVDAVCNNQTLTLSWMRDANARPTPYHIQCKNGTRTVYTVMPEDESFVLTPSSGTMDLSLSIFQWPVQCTVHLCYSNLNLRTSFSILPTTCSFPYPSVSSVPSTASFPPSTKDIPTTIDWKASIASPLNPDKATTAPSTTLSMVNEQSIISSSFSTEIAVSAPSVTSTTLMMTINEESIHSISAKITATGTGTSVTILTTLPSTDPMQQTDNGGTRANGGATTSHTLLQSTVIQMPSNVSDTGDTENISLSVSLSITIPVTIVVLAFIIIISLCWMVMNLLKKLKKPNDYTNSALQDYDPVILSLTKPHNFICGSTVTLTCPLENPKKYFIHELPPPTCATPDASISEEQASSELVHTLEGIKNIITTQEEDHIKPSQSPWDHSSVSFTDFRSDISSQESSQTVYTQGYIYTRRHSYESLAYIHQSDYIVPCSLDNICRAHVSTN